MAKQPDNIMLHMLREICAKQDQHDKRFDTIEKEVVELRQWVVHALGLATTQSIKNRDQDSRLDDNDQKFTELFDKLEEMLGGK